MADQKPSPLRIAREASGLTQRAAAKKVGVTAVHLCYVERGKFDPSLALLRKLAKLYRVGVGKLIEEER